VLFRWLCLLLFALTCRESPAAAEGALVIWVSASGDATALGTLAAQYQASSGVTVTVTVMDPLAKRYGTAAGQGEGPDIALLRHDQMGVLVADGLIAPVNPTADWTAGILPVAMEAVRFDGSTWGYPVAIDALHLI
jgi:maltose/maltodextrin transport system substrate-binding protein